MSFSLFYQYFYSKMVIYYYESPGLDLAQYSTMTTDKVKRHINPLMFGVIDDKPEGVARGIYHV